MAKQYDSETYGMASLGLDSTSYGFDSMFERPPEERDFENDQALRSVHQIMDADGGKAMDFLSYEEVAAGLQGKSMHDFYMDNADRMLEAMDPMKKLQIATGLYMEQNGLNDFQYNQMMSTNPDAIDDVMKTLSPEGFADYMVEKNATDRGMSVDEYESNIEHTQDVVFDHMPGNIERGMYSDDAALTNTERYNRQLDDAYGATHDAKKEASEKEASQKDADEKEASEKEDSEKEASQQEEASEQQEAPQQETPQQDGGVTDGLTDTGEALTSGVQEAAQQGVEEAAGIVEENAPVAGEYGTQGAGTAKEGLRPAEWNSDTIGTYADKMKEGGFISDNTANLIKTLAPVLDQLGLSGAFGNIMANAFEKWGGNSEEMWTENDVFDAQQSAYDQASAEQMDAGESYQSEQVAEAGDYVATDAPDAGSSAHVEGLPVPEVNQVVDEQTHAAEEAEHAEAADSAAQGAEQGTVEDDAEAARRHEYAEWANNLYDENGNMSTAPEPELPGSEGVTAQAEGPKAEPAAEQTPAEVAADACENLGKGDANIEATGYATAPEVIEEPAAAEQVAEQAAETSAPEVAAVESVETAGIEVAADVAEDTIDTTVDVAKEALPDELKTAEWDYGQGDGAKGTADYEGTAADALGSDAGYTAGDAVTIDVDEPTGQHEAENDFDITR